MLDKDKQDTAQSDTLFAQKMKSEIAGHDEKLDRLLDLNLSNEITKEEYNGKKQKILNQKIDIQEKLKVFEKKIKEGKNDVASAAKGKECGLLLKPQYTEVQTGYYIEVR